jgi:hypothetical protein
MPTTLSSLLKLSVSRFFIITNSPCGILGSVVAFLFSLTRSSDLGWKISVLIYQIITFFGFKKLFIDYFKAKPIRAILLAYIVSFGGFYTYRVIAGHFTFLLIAFVPWLLLLFLKRSARLSWLWFSLVISLMIWSSPHYVTIMCLLVIAMWYVCQKVSDTLNFIKDKNKTVYIQGWLSDAKFFLGALALTFVLTFYRLFYTSQFLSDFPRPTIANEPFTGLRTVLHAIWGVNQYKNPGSLTNGWGWVEASACIGIGTLLALLFICLAWAINIKQGHKSLRGKALFSCSPITLVVLFCFCLLLGMGYLGAYSPYALIHNLPVFNSMRVATRWLMWSSLFVLFIIASYRGQRFNKVINIFLFAAVIELFVFGLPAISKAYFTRVQQYRPPTAQFNQAYKYNLPRPLYAPDQNFQKIYSYDENLYETTMNNYGQIIAGDALVDTRQPGTTMRCGFNHISSCYFVSNNAKVTLWSPNKIILSRQGPGDIKINMNPGRYWRINGKYVFSTYKVTEPKKLFIVRDKSKTIVLEYAPSLF